MSKKTSANLGQMSEKMKHMSSCNKMRHNQHQQLSSSGQLNFHKKLIWPLLYYPSYKKQIHMPQKWQSCAGLLDVPMAKVREKGAALSFRRGSQRMKAMTTSVVPSHDKSNISQTFDHSIQSVQSPSEINKRNNQISVINDLSYQPAGSNPQQLPQTVSSPSIPTSSEPTTQGWNTVPKLQKFLGLCKKI